MADSIMALAPLPVGSLTFGNPAGADRRYSLAGQAFVVDAGGRKALSVDGGYARLGLLDEFVGVDALTVSFAFNRKQATGATTKLFWHTGNHGVAITDSRYLVTVVGEDGVGRSFRSEPMAIADNVWTDVALSLDKDSGALRMHVDGVLVIAADDVSMRFTTTAREADFGGAATSGSGFDGMVDDLRFFDAALTPAQIAGSAPAESRAAPLVLAPDSAVAAQGRATVVDVLANDAGQGTLTLLSARSAAGGAVVIKDGALAYTPRPGFFGEDRLTYRAADASGATAEAEALVTVGVVVRDAAELSAALAAARGGELILLAPGDYGSVSLDGRSKAYLGYGAEVTLRSLDAGQMARFSGLNLHSVRNLSFEAILFDYEAAPNAIDAVKPFQVTASASVAIRDSVFDGALAVSSDPARAGFATGHGLSVRDSRDIAVEDNAFFDWHRGAVFSTSDGLAVSGNLVHRMRSDGFNFTGVSDVAITENTFKDFRASRATGDHSDMIQFWTTGQTRPNADILIARNVLDAGAGDYTQSIFMRNEEVDNGRAGSEMFYRNLRIEDNLIRNAHLHGVTVGETDGLVIADNTIAHSAAVASGGSVHVPRINVAAASRNVAISGNLVSAAPQAAASGWSVSDNVLIQRDRPDAPGYYGDVFADGLADHRPALEALRTLPEMAGHGSSLARIGAPDAAPYAYILAEAGAGLGRMAVEYRIGGVYDAAGAADARGASVRWAFEGGQTASAAALRHRHDAAGVEEVRAVIRLADGREVEAFRTVAVETPLAVLATFEGTVADLSDLPNAATAGKTASLVFADGDGAARLAGGSDTIAFARSGELIGNEAYTLLVDYKKAAAQTGGKLVHFSGSVVVTLGADTIRVDLTTDAGPARLDHRAASLRDTAWRNLAVVFDGEDGAASLYVDGAAVARKTGLGALQPGSAFHDLHLGSPFGGGFVGLVDNFAFLRGAMTDAEIAAHVAADRPAAPADFDFGAPDLAFVAPVDPW